MMDIINKLKEKNLLGRSGSGFPTGLKWEQVLNAKASKKYVVCNASSGEPQVLKDEFILENHPQEVIEGIEIALKTIDNSSGYIYLNKDFYARFKEILGQLTKGLPITLFKKPGGYLAGEETCLCEAIEGKRPEPRIKPPFPTESGLWGYPTLINNVETFYYVSKIAKDQYENTRFYTLSGEVKNKGVYELPLDWSVGKILRETGNWPDFDFFAQVGGGACGGIFLPNELDCPVGGPGAIIVFDRDKTDPFSLMREWADFFLRENCDKCVPCREGVYKIKEMVRKKKIDKDLLKEITFSTRKTSLCGLGKVIGNSFDSLIDKIL